MDELNESQQIGSTLPNFADVSSLLPGEYPGIMVETLLFWPPIPILVQMMKFSEQRKMNDKVADASSGEDILASAQATCRLQATARWQR